MTTEADLSEATSTWQQADTTPSKPIEDRDMPNTYSSSWDSWRARFRHISHCTSFSLISVLLLVILVSSLSSNPLYAIFFAFLGILPAGVVARFIMTKFKDEAVSEKFLINQFLIGSIPLALVVILVEFILSAIFFLALFSHELASFRDEMDGNLNGTIPVNITTPANTTRVLTSLQLEPILLGVGRRSLVETLSQSAPLWKIMLFSLLNAFLVAALVEEVGKWIVSRRYRKVNSEPLNQELGRTISCRGILAVCSMGALGFATIENLGFILALSASRSDGFPFDLVLMALLRGVLAFPVHVGAQFFVGVTAAQNYVFNDDGRVLYALLLVILFHGSFDAAALEIANLVTISSWPEWSMVFVVVFQLCLTALLMILCRGRYKALLERERIAAPVEEGV